MGDRRVIYIGFDRREAAAFAVARRSAWRRMTQPIPIKGLVLSTVTKRGLYCRPIQYKDGPLGNRIMWDEISDAPMSTEHACARFLVPYLAETGWALFMDGDVLVRGNLTRVFDGLDPRKAVYCVQHRHIPTLGVKMDNQQQTQYARKNWSSFMIWNCDHPANQALTLEMVNAWPGRDLHAFRWLDDKDIGALDPAWNHLVGAQPENPQAKVAHFTLGTPDMPGFGECEFAEEWRAELAEWAE